MMNKSELAKVISKKAAVTDSSAKEFFDLFLQRIATELKSGESARFSNVGYFHFRKGKIKKEHGDIENVKFEYLDLIIFSPAKEFNIKSVGNLVFSVPESKNTQHDKLDSHFSLSVGKPVLPNLDIKNSYYPSVQPPEELEKIMKRKIENLMLNLEKEEVGKSDSEILLVDVKTVYDDQLELELDEESKKKNSTVVEKTTIHSSDKLKSIAWGLGKDLSKQIDQDSISDVEKSNDDAQIKNQELSWDFGRRFWENQAVASGNEKTDTNKIEPEKVKKDETTKSIKLGFPSSSLDEKKIGDLGIHMDDFKVSENADKIGKFERVRSISSSLDGKNSLRENKELGKFIDKSLETKTKTVKSDEKFMKVTSKAEQFHTPSVKKVTDEPILFEDKKKPVKDIKLNRSDALKRHKSYARKSSATRFLTIAAIMVIVVGVLYLFLKNSNTEKIAEEVVLPIERDKNATYVERSYEIPVTYPYSKSDKETQVTGLGSNKLTEIKAETVKEEKKLTVEESPKIEKRTINKTGVKPSGTPVQAAYNIYQYGDIFVVQVAAFRANSVAEKEIKRYLGEGYNAFIEEANLQGTIWYRVRVGNFKTLEEAKQFRKLN